MFTDIETKYQALIRGETIGFGATAVIQNLFNTERITEEQKDTFLERHFPNRARIIEANQDTILVTDPETGKKFTKKGMNSIRATKCSDCGELLNGGTYGYIFRSLSDSTKIIKGSSEGHAEAFSCPPDFEREHQMHTKIAAYFPSLKLKTISLINIYSNWIENRRCYLKMDEIRPIVLTDVQIAKARNKQKTLAEKNAHIIDKLLEKKCLFMLLPGDEEPFRAEEGGGETSQWIEIGRKTIDVYLALLNIKPKQYYKDLKKLVDGSIKNNIKLNDVEFILGSINGINQVVMIDFDKVEEMKTAEKDKFLETKMSVLNQPVFPKTLSGGRYKTRKFRKRKKNRRSAKINT
jgi:hypothetical protein